ncbi:NADPH-dependent FMN reductase [Nocardia sp. NPDC056064]|uniref:NADPH-dependent FMN reductase n=1 Tax=Nocardia sp. NPDC056064 TaxID=3345701 RepID=UPI0035E15E99
MQTPLRLEVIVASVRPERFAPVVADWFLAEAARRSEFEVGVLDLRELALPVDLTETEAVRQFRDRIGTADAFVAVTSEYNHGYPASLKTALDSVKHEWRAKPIGFVSYGGLSGGLRAVEQLRQVITELHMVPVRESVSFAQAKRRFDAAGGTDDRAAIDASARMLGQLAWWGRTLRAARTADPYPG